ncbi:hypothetical protein [uncultured Polaribacter sp.]|uniref:hypothetical protein n=1 Tax=uncultured Polaribacter sp. TaxID=174711 RepID=UPI002633FFA6|nr:hypothetical protein [uncultured Polaribacter sp.]
MLGLFKKNKDEEIKQPKEEHQEFIVLSKKWDVFLDKINTRFEESIGYAEEAIMENLVESDFDIHPTTRAWHGMKSQLMSMMNKIDTTFDEKVKPQMLAYKEDWELIDEGQKGTILRESIYERIERYEIFIEGKIAKKFYDHAIQLLNHDFNCTQCSAKIEVRKDIFRSHYVSCDYCNTVNTFTPNTKIAEIRGFAIDNIAKYNAIQEWDEYKKAQNAFNQIRPPSKNEDKTKYITGFIEREETEKAFWLKYFVERSILLPEYKDTIDHDVNVKMKHFYEERKRKLNV